MVELVARGLAGASAVTQAAHIFPQSTNQALGMVEGGSKERPSVYPLVRSSTMVYSLIMQPQYGLSWSVLGRSTVS